MISGYLRQVMETKEQDTCCYSYFVFEADDGSVVEDVQNYSDVPTNIHIYVKFEDNRIVKWDFHPKQAYIENNKKDIALVHVVPVGQANNQAWNRVNNNAARLERFIHHANRGYRWEFIRVTAYVVENTINAGLGLHFPFNRIDIKDQMEEQHPGRYDEHVYWHGLGGYRSGILGHAYVNSNKAWTYSGDWRTVNHEQGHNFGSMHSKGSNGEEYGHPYCIMARSRGGFCGSQMLGLGLIDDEHVVENENNVTHFLAPLECNPTDLRTGEKQIIRLGNFVVSTRKPNDQNALGVGNTDPDGTLHVELGSHLRYPEYRRRIVEGDSDELNNVTIKNLGNKDGVVQVSLGNSSSQDYPEAQAPMESDVELNHENLSGIWGDPRYAKQGVDMSVIPNEKRVTGFLYTYHPRGSVGMPPATRSSREWFELDGKIHDDGYITVDMYYYPSREQKKVGEGTMTILDGRMKFRFFCENFGRDSFELERFTTPKEDWGIWETGDHTGYSVAKYLDHKKKPIWVAYHFTHGGIRDVTWSMLDGRDLSDMTRHTFTGVYKELNSDNNNIGHEVSDSVNLTEILKSAVPIIVSE